MSAIDKKINMSLDEIIKSQKNAAKKTAPKPAAKKLAAKPSPAAGKKAGKGKGNAPAAPLSKKAAQSIGGAQAKRAATTAQRRGLATTGKATNAQVRNQVKKAGAKLQTQSVASAGRRGKASAAAGKPRPSSAPAAIPAGLKISFKPAELKKTTEKNVALQIRAVLGKTPTNNAPRVNNAPRQVATGAGGAGARRSNPKRRNQQRGPR